MARLYNDDAILHLISPLAVTKFNKGCMKFYHVPVWLLITVN